MKPLPGSLQDPCPEGSAAVASARSSSTFSALKARGPRLCAHDHLHLRVQCHRLEQQLSTESTNWQHKTRVQTQELSCQGHQQPSSQRALKRLSYEPLLALPMRNTPSTSSKSQEEDPAATASLIYSTKRPLSGELRGLVPLLWSLPTHSPEAELTSELCPISMYLTPHTCVLARPPAGHLYSIPLAKWNWADGHSANALSWFPPVPWSGLVVAVITISFLFSDNHPTFQITEIAFNVLLPFYFVLYYIYHYLPSKNIILLLGKLFDWNTLHSNMLLNVKSNPG